MLIGGAVLLLGMQAAGKLYPHVYGSEGLVVGLAQDWVGFIISLIMMIGMVLVMPWLKARKGHEQLREVLSERRIIVEEHQQHQLQSLRQMQMALEVGKPVNVIMGQVHELTSMVQGFSEAMKSGLIVGSNLSIALEALIDEMTREHTVPMKVDIHSDAAACLSREQGLQLLHITREAISNTQRHAKAKKGQVTLNKHEKAVTLEIVDKGQGFEVDLVEAQGHGIGNMVARAKKIGARLKINSDIKQGTHVYVEVPITGHASEMS